MRTAVIGEFAPPHDAVTLFNRCLVDDLGADEVCLGDEGQLAAGGLRGFLRGVIDVIDDSDRLIYLTRAYDRRSLLHLYLALRLARSRCRRIELVLHSELFSFLGPMRSRHVGMPMLRGCLSRVDAVACGDERTAELLRSLAPPSCEVRVDQQCIDLDQREMPTGTPSVVVCCDRDSVQLIDEARRLRHQLARDRDEPIAVVVLAYDCPGLDRERVDAVIENPSAAQATAYFAAARSIIRPLRCMGVTKFPDDWFMLERPEVSGQLDLSDGVTVLRRPRDAGAADPIVACVAADVAATNPESVVFVGVCDGRSAEAEVNRALVEQMEHDGVCVQRLTLPCDGFDGETLRSYVDFARRLRRVVSRRSLVVCATQGCTRPSLLLLFTAAVLSRLGGARFSVVLHPELFDFFGRLRSRNAGLPLLFTTFSLASAVYGTAESCVVARQYKNDPDKFREVSFPVRRVDDRRDESAPAWLVSVVDTTSHHIFGVTTRPLTCDGVSISPIDIALCCDAYNERHEIVERLIAITKGANGLSCALTGLTPRRTDDLDLIDTGHHR